MLKLSEYFVSFQGEARWVGRIAHFFRFTGCNLNCEWCDTADRRNVCNLEMSVDEFREIVNRGDIRHIVFTGGEPMLHKDLLIRLAKYIPNDFTVEVETNGTIKIPRDLTDRSNWYWNVSPKVEFMDRYEEPPLDVRHPNVIFKFVVIDDVAGVKAFINRWEIPQDKVYLMANSKSYLEYVERSRTVMKLAEENRWNFSPRLQLVHYIS